MVAQGAGLYNPYTLSGAMAVDGVAVSCHNSWLAAGLMQTVGLRPDWLPSLFQAAYAPARLLYSYLGKRAYVSSLESAAAVGKGVGGLAALLGLTAPAAASA